MLKDRSKERGFSLVELAVAAAILLVVGVAAAAMIARFTAATTANTEVGELEEVRAVTTDAGRTDFDGAGRNLTRSEPPGSGTEPWLFTNDSNYTSPSPGVITRPVANAALPFKSARRGFGSGTGSLRYTPAASLNTFHVELDGSDGTYRRISISNNGVYIYENGQLAAASFTWPGAGLVTPHQSGDSYRISLEDTPTGRTFCYYRTRGGTESLMYTSARGVMPYPLTPKLAIYDSGGSISGLSLTGAPIIYLNEGAVQTAPMPFDRGLRLTGPVTISGNSATILSGDPDTDIVYSSGAFSSTTGSMTPVAPPKRGRFNTGDYAMVIDFQANRAALYSVEVLDQAAGTLNLRLVTQSSPAWGRLWSDESDPLSVWQPGTAIVKLTPPVTYTKADDGRLVRMEGDRPATLAFNVRTFSVSEQTSVTGKSYTLAMTLAAEGFETASGNSDESRTVVEYKSSPRSLNLYANQLN